MVRALCLLGWTLAVLLIATPTSLRATEQRFLSEISDQIASAPDMRIPPDLSASTDLADRRTIAEAIWAAAADTGVDYEYLLSAAQIESGLDPRAQAATSSAAGLFQFIETTWLASLDRHNMQYAALSKAKGWSQNVTAASAARSREALLELRANPQIAALVAAADTAENRRFLRRLLGREAGHTELYLAHFLGTGGATRFLNAWRANPQANAAKLFPRAARANAPVFYARNGRAHSLEEVRGAIAAKFKRASQHIEDLVRWPPAESGEDKCSKSNQRFRYSSSDLIADSERAQTRPLAPAKGEGESPTQPWPVSTSGEICKESTLSDVRQMLTEASSQLQRTIPAQLLTQEGAGNGFFTKTSAGTATGLRARAISIWNFSDPPSQATMIAFDCSGSGIDCAAVERAPIPLAHALQKPELPPAPMQDGDLGGSTPLLVHSTRA